MASNANVGDKLLWTAILASGIAAYWYLPSFLHHVKDLTAVAAPRPKTSEPRLQQDAEASIKPSTLAKLASGPNYNITASAIRLTASRFIKDAQAKQRLLSDLSSKEWHRRDCAINALSLLLSNPALKENAIRQHFIDQPTYTALVIALVNLLPEHQRESKSAAPPTSPVRPATRPAHEHSILQLIILLLEKPGNYGSNSFYIVDVQPAIYAGIITKWLKHYPFPCALPENRRFNFRKSDVCTLLEPDIWGSDDLLMSNLVQMLIRLPSGARQLTDAGLRTISLHDRSDIGSREWATRSHPTLSFTEFHPRPVWSPTSQSTRDDRNEDAAELIDEAELFSRFQDTQRRLQSGRTPGERSRQRRHRQAIVVAEAGAPLRPENILQRQPTETEISWQQEVQNRQGQLLRSASTRSGGGGDEDAIDQLARERIDGLDEGGSVFTPFRLPDLDDLPSAIDSQQHVLDDSTDQDGPPPG